MTTIPSLLPAVGSLAQKRLELGPRLAAPDLAATPDLAKAWAENARTLRAEAIARRLEVAERILDILRPMVSGMVRSGSSVLARPIAGTLEGVARQLSDLSRDFEGAVDDARHPDTPDAHRQTLRELGGRLTATVERAGHMVLWVHAVASDEASFGRRSARQLAHDAAGHLLDAWGRIKAALINLPRAAAPPPSRVSLSV